MPVLFHWSKAFETGLDFVDQQHRYLVSIVNELGTLLLNDTAIDQATLENYHRSLVDYSRFHFAEEMTNMRRWDLDLRHMRVHAGEHQRFLEELQQVNSGAPLSAERIQEVLIFLTNWLAYHILGIDQSMARQIALIRQGMTPAAAYDEETSRQEGRSEPLLEALRVLYHNVLKKNRSLQAINRELDQRVRQRTAELESANRKLQQQAIIDELSGLYNRRFALATLQQLWAGIRRSGRSIAVLMLDVDKFKPVNDGFGHAAGDALLCRLAQHLKSSVRRSDYVCRMGGDEFLIICPDSTLAGATEVANKVLAGLKPFYLDSGELCWQGGISIGIADARADMAAVDELLAAADAALYEAKRQGGNGCQCQPGAPAD